MNQDPKQTRDSQEKEIDLGVVFNAFYKIIQKIAAFFTFLFVSLFNIIIGIFLIIKKRWLFFLLALLAGVVAAYLDYSKRGAEYYSDMTVKTNFGSSRSLYQRISFFNALVESGQTAELGKIFNISATDASNIRSFEISPIKDALEVARLYKTTFLDVKRQYISWSDTSWARIFKYEESETMWNDYDFPLHQIRVYTSTPLINPNIQRGIVHSIDSNETLQHTIKTARDLMAQEEILVTNSLKGIDSLRMAYIKMISRSTQEPAAEKGSIILSDKTLRSPEIELFDKEMMLKNELHDLKVRQAELMEVLQVTSDLGQVGTKRSVMIRIFASYILISLAIVFTIILAFAFVRYLNEFEKKKKKYALV